MASEPERQSEEYRFEQLAPGVYFGEARRQGTALSNAGVVDLGDSALAFDTGLTLRAGRELRRAVQILTKKPLGLSANSHWHMDHILGNQLFEDRPIYATRRTVEILLERRAEFERDLTREKIEADLREIGGQKGTVSEPTKDQREEYAMALRINRTLLDEVLELRFTPPSATFDGSLDLPGARKARLVTFGGGHTESDALLVLPAERIVFAGDLVVSGRHPNLLSGNPPQWIEILKRIEALQPERIVTGHGPMGNLETVRMLGDYLTFLTGHAQSTGRLDVPAPFRDWIGEGQFQRNLDFVRSQNKSPPR